jgi:hypothetical protein
MILFWCGIMSLKEFVSNGKDSTQVSNTDLLWLYHAAKTKLKQEQDYIILSSHYRYFSS